MLFGLSLWVGWVRGQTFDLSNRSNLSDPSNLLNPSNLLVPSPLKGFCLGSVLDLGVGVQANG
jgi:hypothetical protein